MTEQIDVLSDIASAFSDFARMPRSNAGTVDLAQVAMLAMETYRGVHHIHFQQQWEKSGTYLVKADRNQLLRVFNNLIKNAIQAIGPVKGEVGITITRTGSFYRVSVSDTGPGIPEEKRDKIFTPNFTTKTSGMGLGLAIVRSTILSYGGEVWYETDEVKGTIFGFTLPAQTDEVSAEGKMD
jgi:signal transduction histidine kinase